MLDPWIIEEIQKREREKREEQDRARIELPAPDPSEEPGAPESPDRKPEMPSDRKPGYEMPNPSEPSRKPEEKKDDEPKRGVDISRITGTDDDEDDGSSITVNIKDLPEMPKDDAPPKKPE